MTLDFCLEAIEFVILAMLLFLQELQPFACEEDFHFEHEPEMHLLGWRVSKNHIATEEARAFEAHAVSLAELPHLT